MALFAQIHRSLRANYFLNFLSKDSKILEIGCADGWFRRYVNERGMDNYVGLDLKPPADVIGDIRNWRSLGLQPGTFDAIVAFEVIEHVLCLQDCFDLLKSGGVLLVTTPVPHMDWLCETLEQIGLNQKRTSPHDHLIYLSDVKDFQAIELKTIAFISQWGVFRKP